MSRRFIDTLCKVGATAGEECKAKADCAGEFACPESATEGTKTCTDGAIVGEECKGTRN